MDRDQFTSLYMALFEALCRFASTITGSIDTAQEIVQDVFFTLWEKRGTIQIQGDPQVYLYTAVRNRARKAGRHDNVVKRLENAVAQSHVEPPAIGTPLPSPDAELEAAEVKQAVATALAGVTDHEREALYLRWEQGKTYDEIGQILGVTSMGAHKMVARAAERVRGILAGLRNEE